MAITPGAKNANSMDVVRKHGKRNKLLRRLAIGLVVTIGTIGATVAIGRLEPAVPSVERNMVVIESVKRGEMLRQVRAHGTLVPIDVAWITAETSGRITALPLKPGVAVEPDTVILKIANPQLDKDLEDAKWAHTSETANLRALEADLKNQLLELQATVTEIQGNVDDAQLQLDVDRALFADALISEQRLKLSEGRCKQLQERLNFSNEKARTFENSIESQLDVQRAKVAQALAMYELRQKQVVNLTICAGIKGILQQLGRSSESTETEPLAIGQWVVEGTPLALISDPEHLQAQLRVPESQAGDILFGQSVEVDARVAMIPGEVIRIDPAVRQGTVMIDVRLEGALPNGMRPDLNVSGTILIERLEDVLYTGRIMQGGGGSTVSLFKLSSDGKYAERAKVTLGSNSVHTTEITAGLAVGDSVIVSDMSNWDEHERLRLQ